MKIQFLTKYIIRLLLVFLLFSGCRDLVQTEFPEMEPAPVINAVLIAGDSAHVQISQSASLDTNKIKWLGNAVVEFYEDENFIENLEYTHSGFYKGNSIIKENKTYRCEINIPGTGSYTCTTTVPKAERIRSYKIVEQANKSEEGFTYPSMDVTFSMLLDKSEYFDIRIIMFAEGYQFEPEIMEHTDPVLLNEGFQQTFFSNEMIRDTSHTITINFFSGSLSGSIGGVLKTDLYPMVVEFRTVDESYYDYSRQFYLYENGRYPEFSFSSASSYILYSNIENAYGIFTSYAVHSTDTIYPSGYEN